MPAEQNMPARKASLAAEVAKLLKQLRERYLSPPDSQPLPLIDPETMAETWRKDRETAIAKWSEAMKTAIANQKPLLISPLQSMRLFPSPAELSSLDEAVDKLAKAIGVVLFRFQDRIPIFKRLEHDYRRLKLFGFALELSKRVAAVPEPPLTKLAKILAGKLTDGERETVSALYVSLGGSPQPLGAHYRASQPNAKKLWEDFNPWLVRLTSASFKKAVPTQGALMPAYFPKIAFRDVLCQQQHWRVCYEASLDPTAHWLSGLLDQEIYANLRVPLYGRLYDPKTMLMNLRKLAACGRSRSYRERRKSGSIAP